MVTDVRAAFEALRRDLIHEDGPQISTMRNYRFAIVQYSPRLERARREETDRLHADLVSHGWAVLVIDLGNLLAQRLREQGEDWVARVIAMEKRMAEVAPERGLGYLKSRVTPLIEGPEGIAADCAERIRRFVDDHPDARERTLALIGGAGALYPFLRSSALLRHLDGRTGNIPVVLLYPGERTGPTSLSFMGVLDPDSDYRPRIYS